MVAGEGVGGKGEYFISIIDATATNTANIEIKLLLIRGTCTSTPGVSSSSCTDSTFPRDTALIRAVVPIVSLALISAPEFKRVWITSFGDSGF